jgi:hypothetical protein
LHSMRLLNKILSQIVHQTQMSAKKPGFCSENPVSRLDTLI